jgi:hypothetical protein
MKTHSLVSLVLTVVVLGDIANGQAGSAATKGSAEAMRIIAASQRQMAELEEAWRTSKKLTLLEKLPTWPRNQSECLSVGRLDNGDVGYLEYWHFEVCQVVGPNDLLLTLKNPDIPPIWLTGYSTDRLVDGDRVRLVGLVEIEGTKTYRTAAGTTNTVRVVRLVDRDRMAQMEARLEANRKELEANRKEAAAKAKTQADALAWQDRWAKEKRTWKDKTGNFSVEAVYDEYLDDGKIRLLKEDKTEIIVHLSKLSDSDRQKAVAIKRPVHLLTSRAWVRVTQTNGERARFTFHVDGSCIGKLDSKGTSDWTKWELKGTQLILYGRKPNSTGTFTYNVDKNRFQGGTEAGVQFHFE